MNKFIFQNILKLGLALGIATFAVVIPQNQAKASLIGDTVNLEVFNEDDLSTFSDSATVIDPGVEFNTLSSELSVFEDLDVFAESFDILYGIKDTAPPDLVGLLSPKQFVLSDLDWLPEPGIITGVTQTAGTTVTNIAFTDNSIIIDMPQIVLGGTDPVRPRSETFSFDIQTEHESTPEPATLLGLLVVGGLGLVSRRQG